MRVVGVIIKTDLSSKHYRNLSIIRPWPGLVHFDIRLFSHLPTFFQYSKYLIVISVPTFLPKIITYSYLPNSFSIVALKKCKAFFFM